jgi:hypothetical protein
MTPWIFALQHIVGRMGGVTPPVRVEEYKARSAPLMPDSKLHRRPQFDPVIWCVDQILLGAEVSLRRLDARMAEQHLDLFEFTAGGAAQLCSRAATVMRRDACDASRIFACDLQTTEPRRYQPDRRSMRRPAPALHHAPTRRPF